MLRKTQTITGSGSPDYSRLKGSSGDGHEQSPPKPDSDGGNQTVTQLVQIKYLLAGILALIVVGRFEDWGTNALTVCATFSLVYSLDTIWFCLPGLVSRLASVRSRRRAAKAESEARLRRLLRELEEAERQIRNE